MASASTSRVAPSGVVPWTATVAGRARLPVRSGTLMQPSRATAGAPVATSSGSSSTTSPAQERALGWPVTSTQNARRPTPDLGGGHADTVVVGPHGVDQIGGRGGGRDGVAGRPGHGLERRRRQAEDG